MEVYVKDYQGQRFTLVCDSDDNVSILLHRYSALCGASIDKSVYKFVVEGMEEVGENTLLSDLGICHESSLRIGLRKRLVEFQVVDFNAIMLGTAPPDAPVVREGRRRDEEDGRLYDERVKLIKKYGTDEEKTGWDDPERKKRFMSTIHSQVHLPNSIYPHLLSEEVNNGWEIVDINYQWRGSACFLDNYPKVIFKRVV